MSRTVLFLLIVSLVWVSRFATAAPEDYASPLRFAVELDYSPIKFHGLFIDPGTGADAALSQGTTGLWAEWIPLTRWGKLGVGIGYHYVFSRTINFSTGDTSRFNAHLVQLGASYRLDYFRSQYVVPYARLALAAAIPRIIDTSANSETRINLPTQKGIEIAFGGEFLLNWLEPKAALNLDREIGINNLFLFAEYVSFNSPSGSVVDISYRAVRGGVRCEF